MFLSKEFNEKKFIDSENSLKSGVGFLKLK
jgi:hypothetical protein